MEDELQGTLCQAPNTCVQIDQSLWDPEGIATIEATIDATPGTKVVFSYSEGARSVTDWLMQHADDADAPSPAELSFVVIGNPTRAYGGSDRDVMPQTQYQVIDISRQYDFASDFPDHPLNLLTLLNSLMAFTVIHTDYENVDMYDPANIVWTEGNTTYVFVPTKNLPLLEPLRNLGLTGLADALNEPLKKLVERGYDRSYLPATTEPVDTVRLSVPTDSDPALRAGELTPEPRVVELADSGVVNAPAAEPVSNADDDAEATALPTTESAETDQGGIEDDEKTVTAGRKKYSAAARAEEAGAESTTSTQESDESTGTDGAETPDTKPEGRDGASPSAGDE